ncbi:MAG: aldo/keto reductase [Gammaproteobacteria bacterium]|nr:aldo/keto reductase [Gammaproteobacteria bacterium]
MRRLWKRREVLVTGIACGALPIIGFGDEAATMRTAIIPTTGEALPVIGLGTYSVFDVESTETEIASKQEIARLLIAGGGSVVDTSPMYNRSEKVIGDVIKAGIDRNDMFLATKVWTDGRDAGMAQMRRSAELMNTDVIDLMQVHNLRNTDTHMNTIREWQDDGQIRYSGITHYTASALEALAREMQTYKPQFIQINYSLGEREAEERIFPLAQELGIAVLVNRPFQAGRLFQAVAGLSLPDFAEDFADSWGQFFLKFIVSHPAVTCAIPATSKARHMSDNLGAGFGELPDPTMRQRMLKFFETL